MRHKQNSTSSFAVRPRGFTLIELVVVVAIVAVLASIGLPLTELAAQRQREEQLRLALRELRDAIDSYKRAVDQGRIARAADASGYPPQLSLLVDGTEDQRSPTGQKLYFLRRLPRDPFAPSELPDANTWGLRSYASPPNDPKPGADVFDVYSMSTRVGLNGVPYRNW
jgi:general secretion pathway protein G